MSINPKPEDFGAYWQAVDDELAGIDPAVELEHSLLRSNEHSTMYFVRLTSVGPYRIFAYLSIPHGDGPFPALLQTPRYGSVNNPPHFDDRQRFVVMTLMHRGQRLADKPYAAAYPGLLTEGIEDPATFIYRGIVADCLRGAEYLLSRPEVEGQPAAVVGDDLAVLTAARRPGFTAVHYNLFTFYRMMEAAPRTAAYPLEEINEHVAFYPNSADRVARTVAYVDPLHHAPEVKGKVLVNVGDPGSLSGPEFLEPLMQAFGSRAEPYVVSHEGGTDHDAADAWIASQLGSVPKPRLWLEAMG
ncbi:MAG: acetylxylan esterase [Thermomicrobiales bacterium]|nr:acetylxylan esterase [Thermomicrobiales bacterium]